MSDFTHLFSRSIKSRELDETRARYSQVLALHRRSVVATAEGEDELATAIAIEACQRADVVPSLVFANALYAIAWDLLRYEGMIGIREIENVERLTMEESVSFRAYLARKERFLSDYSRLSGIAREHLSRVFARIASDLPSSIFEEETDDEASAVPLSAPLIDLCGNPRSAIESVLVGMFNPDVQTAHLFEVTRERLDCNIARASGVDPDERRTTTKKPVWPSSCRLTSDAHVASLYLGGTPFARLFEAEFPFHIPFPTRFEHTHIVGGSGHGKTQLLQLLIHHDLMKAREDGRSVVVIDSQGDLIRTISHLSCFSPVDEKSLADRLIIIDPTDVEYPVCLNMFDFDRGRLGRYLPLEREKILNGTIDLYEYFFGALLGAELTQKQGVIFKYLARLMLEIPDATIHTFRQLMEDGEPFRPYMRKLPPSARSFFETRFFDRGFNETKKQILTRLWGVLSNATFERMFSHTRNKVDVFEATNTGKIILINTAKDLLQQDGSAIFGRFFIALLAQGAIQRSAIPPHERRPTFVYVDEAGDYFDSNIEHLLNQARKYKIGMVLAHQNLDQLSAGLRSSIFASTSIKLAGGVSAKDAGTFAAEMQSDAEFIQGLKKGKERTAFACYVRNLTPHAVGVTVPLGTIERLPAISIAEFATLLTNNRRRYCAPAEEISIPGPPEVTERAAPAAPKRPESSRPVAPTAPAPRPPAPKLEPASTTPAPLGRGGKQHQYLQQLFKQFAEERGFRAVIEEPILEGAGRVDLALRRGDLRIACEISVTTGRDQELGNIEKCLAAGYEQVVLIAAEERHLNAMRRFISESLQELESNRVHFFTPELFMAHLASLDGPPPTEQVVRGYKVKVTKRVTSSSDIDARRAEIARVIARSVKSLKDR